ncbi:MAG TPA: PaaX family transcriptional regulator C-terminal domain-containing protein [Pseudonocardiaceae bacterium]|nr:PaaX family transcriptional regulator C-terminal domain-containing protein [Pseudonocardiaceae bacterium]
MPETTGPGAAPRPLIVSIYGLYARDGGGWLSVSLVIRLLAELGVDEPAVRSAISRLKRRGLLVASRRDGVAGYALSDEAREILAEGDAHIFDPQPAALADGWLLVIFSVPETERAKRHTLRSRLSALGFGAAAPGVWVAPAHRHDLTVITLRRLGLESYVDLFRADYLAFTDIARAVEEWWDLGAIHKSYVEFIARWEGLGWRGSAEAFADWVRLLTDWRRLPYLDPGLPPELLPADWPGVPAAELFHSLRAKLAGPAYDYVRLISAAFTSTGG